MADREKNELVRLTTVKTSGEAEVARLALEAAGIYCQIVGESQAGLAGVLPIKVCVRRAKPLTWGTRKGKTAVVNS